MQKKGIIPQNIYNMDETGFRISCGIASCVVILNKTKSLRFVNSNNRDYVTSVECINIEGWVLPLFVILKGVYILYKWDKNSLSENIVLAVSFTGYSNDQLTYD